MAKRADPSEDDPKRLIPVPNEVDKKMGRAGWGAAVRFPQLGHCACEVRLGFVEREGVGEFGGAR